MQNNCEYCGDPFKAKRVTRKYCSDNCKQLAYFKRNGMVFGINGVKTEDTVKNFTITPIVNDTVKQNANVKELYVKPDSVKQNDSVKTISPVNVKQAESILRQGLKENSEPAAMLSEKQLQELIYRISASLDVKIKEAIVNVKQELAVKYASLYPKPELTQNMPAEVLLCNPIPFKSVTQYESEPVINQEITTTVKPAVKDESEPLAQNTENTLTENEEYFTVNDKKEIPKTLPYLELADDPDNDENEDEHESENENNEDDSELYDMTKEERKTETTTVKHDTENMSDQETEKEDYLNEPEEKLNAHTIKVEQELQENTVTESETTPICNEEQTKMKRQEYEQTQKPTEQKIETEQEYEWVQSKFLKDMENDFEESNGQDFWDDEDPNVEWVNIHLRCVMENIIRLSEYNTIDKETLLRLKDGLNKIVNSYPFNNLPSDYPFIQVTIELAERMNELATNNKSENTPLRINFKAKAKLASMCYQMKDNVPLLKFNELDLAEANSEKNQPALSGSGKKENKKTGGWRAKYKELVLAGRIKDDDFDEDESENEREEETNYHRKSVNPYENRLKYFERTGKFPKKAA